ncbi:MAG: hypothetical protein R3275_01500 [Saprospiraceae bacterium]|nr:hypothetical protein [Saprospiraceae bacterium]
MMIKKPAFWIIVFTLIVIASVIYLFSRENVEPGWLGIPSWVYGFIVLQLIYCAAMWVFVTRFWDHDEKAS